MGVGSAAGQAKTWTLDADFQEGTLINVNHDAPNNDQLQLDETTTPFPFVYIACSSRGTLVRIDVNTCAVLAEYNTAPSGMGTNPSRTTVDQFGNVWVANRNEFSPSPPGGPAKGSVTRIGLVLGGTRVDQNGNPDASGQYLAPPFTYNTCTDRHGATVNDPPDGLIKTSFGLNDILGWSNAGGADTHGGVSTAEDECITVYTRVVGTGTRHLSVDFNNDLWVGGLNNAAFEKLDGVSGAVIAGTQFNLGCGGYGGLIDFNGVIWSARAPLLRYEPDPPIPSVPPGMGVCTNLVPGAYGTGLDPNTGNVWVSELGGSNRVHEIDPVFNVVLNTYPQGASIGNPPAFGCQGVVVDGNSHVWVAEIFGGRIAHYAPDPNIPGTHFFVGNVTGLAGTTGVAVDSNGMIWASEINSSSTRGAARIDPTAGPIGNGGLPIGAISCTVGLNAVGQPNAGPYNYSDMTGFVLLSAIGQGTWTVVYDTGNPGTTGCTIDWNNEPQGAEPPGTSITVEARAADAIPDLPLELYVPVANGGTPAGVAGQYWEIRATLARDPGVTDTPVLSDLSIQCEVPVDIKPGSCPNSFNRNSNGVLPVALVGCDCFDVTQVDVSSVLLSRADNIGGSVSPHEGPPGPHSVFEDVATPFGGQPCDCHELTGDGIVDLSMKFKTQEVVEALELDDLPAGALVELLVTGVQLDGTPFTGRDCIRLVPPGTPPGMLAIGTNAAGGYMELAPLDLQLDGGGFGNFQRTFPLGTVVTLTAEPEFEGRPFQGWRIIAYDQYGGIVGGGPLVPDLTINMTVTTETQTARAIYERVIWPSQPRTWDQ
jgi:streptogramin lyase